MSDSWQCCEMIALEMLRERCHDCVPKQQEAFPTSLPFVTQVEALVHPVVHVPTFSYHQQHYHEIRHVYHRR
jgi:hypothetical protein